MLVPVPTAQEYDAKTTLWRVIGTDTTIPKKQAFFLVFFFLNLTFVAHSKEICAIKMRTLHLNFMNLNI